MMFFTVCRKIFVVAIGFFAAVEAQQKAMTVSYDAVKADTVLGNFRGLKWILLSDSCRTLAYATCSYNNGFRVVNSTGLLVPSS